MKVDISQLNIQGSIDGQAWFHIDKNEAGDFGSQNHIHDDGTVDLVGLQYIRVNVHGLSRLTISDIHKGMEG